MSELTINVLGYEEDGDWVAHALEMDIVGIGDTFEEASKALNELIEMQLSFAAYKKDPSLVMHSAPVQYWNILAELRNSHMTALISGRQVEDAGDYRLGGIPWPAKVSPGEYAVA